MADGDGLARDRRRARRDQERDDIGDLLREVLESERQGLALYHELYKLVADRNIQLEEYARQMIAKEEMHIGEVDKMLRKPGSHGVSGA